MARHSRTLLRAALQIAVLDDVRGANPVIQVDCIHSAAPPKGDPSPDAMQPCDLLVKLGASESCQATDFAWVQPVVADNLYDNYLQPAKLSV